MLREHALAVLTADRPADGLTAGDVGAVVHVYPEGAAYEVEFVTGGGRTLAVLTLPAAEVRPVGDGELLHTRAAA